MVKSKAYIFDIDNTLIDTQAKVIIKNSIGEPIRRLSSKEYNSRANNFGYNMHDIDFAEFDSLSQLLQERKLPTFYTLKDLYKTHTGKNIFICTCRENIRMIKEWLRVFDIDLPITNIVTFDPRIFKTGTDVKQFTVRYLASRYDELHIWEDEHKFIDVMIDAGAEYPACEIYFEPLP